MDFQKIRKEYENRGIDPSQLAADPLVQLKAWYEEAQENCPGRWFETNAMALATTDLAGHVTLRWVLLKGITDEGIQFFTNYESTKGKQLEANPRAAVAIHWPYLGRQVRIEGATEKTTREISEEYFHLRPRGAQLSALASRQSAMVESREQLEQARAALERQHKSQPIPLPEFWGGYLLRPDQFEFWQGREDRLHDRIVYTREESNWRLARLSP